MLGHAKMIILSVVIIFSLSLISFILLANFYPPLNRYLFGGEFQISIDDIQFWVKKVPGRNYYKVCARYMKSLKTEDPKFGHGIYFDIENEGRGWSDIIFNSQDNKIYGGGWWEKDVYCLGEGKIEGEVFKPVFPKNVKFSFRPSGTLDITSAPRDYIKIYFQETLKKLEKEELEKGVLAEILEEETRIRK